MCPQRTKPGYSKPSLIIFSIYHKRKVVFGQNKGWYRMLLASWTTIIYFKYKSVLIEPRYNSNLLPQTAII